jgi:hypothetical protein
VWENKRNKTKRLIKEGEEKVEVLWENKKCDIERERKRERGRERAVEKDQMNKRIER